ncbi:MAG: hypothetical protein IJV96_03355, partial [Clostridia bacterium]|nr:hypothetical protein [Clostridia bacterium]
MKKLITLIGIVLLSCLLLTSCGTYLPDYITFWKELSPSGTIEWDYDDNGIIYNGTKYVNTENYNGKISTDYDS